MRILIAAALAVAATSTITATRADALGLTGEALALACTGNVPDLKPNKDTKEFVKVCNIYINAWDDTASAFLPKEYCAPSGITIKDLSIIFYDYLIYHKEARDISAAKALMEAFKAKWPCRR